MIRRQVRTLNVLLCIVVVVAAPAVWPATYFSFRDWFYLEFLGTRDNVATGTVLGADRVRICGLLYRDRVSIQVDGSEARVFADLMFTKASRLPDHVSFYNPAQAHSEVLLVDEPVHPWLDLFLSVLVLLTPAIAWMNLKIADLVEWAEAKRRENRIESAGEQRANS